MDSQKNNLIVLGGAGILVLILIIFGITGAKSNPPTAGPNFNLDNVPAVSAEDNTRGAANARVRLIEYSDIECPFCQEYHEELLTLVESEPLANFSWTYRHFPLTQIHPSAFGYAVAAECAADQNQFNTYLDTLVNRVRSGDEFDKEELSGLAGSIGLDSNRFSSCLNDESIATRVSDESAQATAAGATGTPFSVFEFDRSISESELEDIQGLFGASTKIVLSDNAQKMAIGGSLGATQIRDIVNLIVDPENDQVEVVESEGTE